MCELEHGALAGFHRGGHGRNQRGLRHCLGLIKHGFGTDWYGAQSGVAVDGWGGVARVNLKGRQADGDGKWWCRARRWGQVAQG